MRIVDDLSQQNADSADSFQGFLAAVIFSGLDVDFAKFIREAWQALDHVSGQTMLVLVPPIGSQDSPLDSSFSPALKQGIQDMLNPRHQAFRIWDIDDVPSGGLPTKTRIEEFGLNLQQVPCLLTLASVREKYAYRFSFPFSEKNRDWKDWFIKIFESADSAFNAGRPRAGATKEEMIQWRRGLNPVLEESLTNAIAWKTTKKVVSKLPFASIGKALFTGGAV